MHNIKFSVMIPNYNHAKFLKERIDSVLNQTFQDFELILLDDYSKDNSREILGSYESDSHVTHILFNEINSGSTFRQWLKGFELSKGEYIWIAESDDFADLHFLEKANEILTQSSNSISLLYYPSNIVNEKSEFSHKQEIYDSQTISFFEGKEFVYQYMLRNNSIINASAVIFKKQFLPTDLQYTEFRFCGDWLFWSIIASQGWVVRINEYYNNFRMHTQKVTPIALTDGVKYVEGSKIMNKLCTLSDVGRFERIQNISLFYSDMLGDIYLKKEKRMRVAKEMTKNLSCFYLYMGYFIHFLKKVRKFI